MPSTRHTAAWAAGAKRSARLAAPPTAGPPNSPRPPRPPSRPAPPRPGGGGPAAPAAARGDSEPNARGRDGGGALGSSCGRGAPRALDRRRARHPAVCTLPCRGATARFSADSPRAPAPLAATGDPPVAPRASPRLSPTLLPWLVREPQAYPAPALIRPPLRFAHSPSSVRGSRAGRPAFGPGSHGAACRPALNPPGSRAPRFPRGGAGLCVRSRDRRGAVETPARAGRGAGGGTSYKSPAPRVPRRGSPHYPRFAQLPPTRLSLLRFFLLSCLPT